jgi:hypothetical protein
MRGDRPKEHAERVERANTQRRRSTVKSRKQLSIARNQGNQPRRSTVKSHGSQLQMSTVKNRKRLSTINSP